MYVYCRLFASIAYIVVQFWLCVYIVWLHLPLEASSSWKTISLALGVNLVFSSWIQFRQIRSHIQVLLSSRVCLTFQQNNRPRLPTYIQQVNILLFNQREKKKKSKDREVCFASVFRHDNVIYFCLFCLFWHFWGFLGTVKELIARYTLDYFLRPLLSRLYLCLSHCLNGKSLSITLVVFFFFSYFCHGV